MSSANEPKELHVMLRFPGWKGPNVNVFQSSESHLSAAFFDVREKVNRILIVCQLVTFLSY